MEQGKIWTWKLLATFLGVMSVLGVVAIFVSVGMYQIFRGSAPVSTTITVQGEGEVMAVPDIAQITLTVTEEGKTAADSQTKVTTKMNKVLVYLKEQNINEKDIKTTGYYTNPKYAYSTSVPVPMMDVRDVELKAAYSSYGPETVVSPSSYPYPCYDYNCPPYGESVITGYETSHSLEIKIRDTNKAGDILAGIGKIGVTYTSGVSLTYDDYKKLQDEAKIKAIQDAREQARNLVSELGVRLGRVVSYSDYGYGGGPYYEKYAVMSADMGGEGLGGAVPPSPELPAGENTITASVSVTYEIR
ncbi:MAG TPA: SIMPL domain-containing protein [Candidatus Paceibacterota bacterium]